MEFWVITEFTKEKIEHILFSQHKHITFVKNI